MMPSCSQRGTSCPRIRRRPSRTPSRGSRRPGPSGIGGVAVARHRRRRDANNGIDIPVRLMFNLWERQPIMCMRWFPDLAREEFRAWQVVSRASSGYLAAEAAPHARTENLAIELAPKIRVNAVAPAVVKTPLYEGFIHRDETVQTLARF